MLHKQTPPFAPRAHGVLLCAYSGFLPTILFVKMAVALALLALPLRAGGAQRVPT